MIYFHLHPANHFWAHSDARCGRCANVSPARFEVSFTKHHDDCTGTKRDFPAPQFPTPRHLLIDSSLPPLDFSIIYSHAHCSNCFSGSNTPCAARRIEMWNVTEVAAIGQSIMSRICTWHLILDFQGQYPWAWNITTRAQMRSRVLRWKRYPAGRPEGHSVSSQPYRQAEVCSSWMIIERITTAEPPWLASTARMR